MKKYILPMIMLTIFETIAITLWLTKDNLFYLFNFSYIGISISLGSTRDSAPGWIIHAGISGADQQ